MKHLQIFFVFALSFFLLLSSCSKDSTNSTNTDNENTSGSSSITATLTGSENVNFKASGLGFASFITQGSGQFAQSVLSGTFVNGNKTYIIMIQLFNYDGKTGEQNPMQSTITVQSSGGAINQFVDYNGNFNVTSNTSSNISGTFSFSASVGSTVINVSDGKFSIKK